MSDHTLLVIIAVGVGVMALAALGVANAVGSAANTLGRLCGRYERLTDARAEAILEAEEEGERVGSNACIVWTVVMMRSTLPLNRIVKA